MSGPHLSNRFLELVQYDLHLEEEQSLGMPTQSRRRTLGVFTVSLVVVAVSKIAGALVIFMTGTDRSAMNVTVPLVFIGIHLLAFGGSGVALLFAHARDSRTAHLGVVLLLIGSAFATTHFAAFAERVPPLNIMRSLYPDAFIAYYFAKFVRDFPRRLPNSFPDRFARVLLLTSALLGWTLFVANASGAMPSADRSAYTAALTRRSASGTFYWTSTFALVLLVLPVSLSGLQYLPLSDRRRIRWFWSTFAAGFGPLVFAVVLGGLPHYGPAITQRILSTWLGTALQVLLATVPLCVAYGLLVKKMLPVRVVLRVAIQHLLARWTVTALAIIPSVFITIHLYLHRNETVSAVLAGHYSLLFAMPLLSAVALCLHKDILRLIDRYFFREAYDTAQLLITLSAQSRTIRRLDELVAVLTAGIDRSLRPDRIAVLLREPSNRSFVALFGVVESLSCQSILADLLAVASEPLDVDLDMRGAFRWLPRAERQWLVDSGSRLLVPLRSTQIGVLGFVTLGERKGELPFSREDRRLLQAIADSAALTIETHSARSGDDSGAGDAPWQVGMSPPLDAGECQNCGLISAAGGRCCGECGGPVRPAQVPSVMFGKFRFERRVGQGAMGVVYCAVDLTLDRKVAIKTLPGTSPEHSRRLYLEARAMAAVGHRNLAVIHGAESWRGRPMLIVEFMGRGTLALRLNNGPLPAADALTLGIALGEALKVIHGAGLLHRDIKPSNIGYTDTWTPKLLDFGLAHILTHSVAERAASDVPIAQSFMASLSNSQTPAGTPLYLSPEATRGWQPDPSFDLWSLNVLLLEAMTGRHPFRARSVEDTFSLIRRGDIRAELAMLGRPTLASYFEKALSLDVARRPGTAAEMVSSLRGLS